MRLVDPVNLNFQPLNEQAIRGANVACIYVSAGQFISAIVLLQYMKFFSQQVSRESRVAVRLGTIGISLHLGQVVVELWDAILTENMKRASRASFNLSSTMRVGNHTSISCGRLYRSAWALA
ncbi:hypothetical protein MJO29_015855 [Puccinia striiformis f. sp. tritici]|nr:hypothetical protein MJO29_015855 [Puccinia striiformis f. sp. tritici]